jgi:hypothetical protein
MPRALNGEELAIFEGVGFDSAGCGPYTESEGCPNCAKGAGWVIAMGLDDVPCSRACELQLEHAAAIEAGEKAARR